MGYGMRVQDRDRLCVSQPKSQSPERLHKHGEACEYRNTIQ